MVDTTPYPGAPGDSGNISNIEKALGQGAFVVGSTPGAGNYGQDITEALVKSMIPGQAPSMTSDPWTSMADFATKFNTYLQGFELDTLKIIQPFIPGATDADFADVPTAVNKILGAFNLSYMMSVQDFQAWLDGIFNPNAPAWADASAKWTAFIAQITALDTALGSGPLTPTSWGTYLTGFFEALGFDPTTSATVAEFLGGGPNWQALYDAIGTGVTDLTSYTAWLLNIPTALTSLNDLQTTTSTAVEDISTDLARQALNNKLYHAVDPTLEGVFDLTSLNGTTPTTVTIDENTSRIGFINIKTSATKYTFSYFGGGITNVTHIFANIYKLDPSVGSLTLVWASGDILPYVGATLDWIYAPIDTPFDVVSGEVYALEIQMVGSGTHTLVGLPSHWITPNDAVFPQQLGATRDTMTEPTFGNSDTGTFNTNASTTATVTESYTAPSGDDVFIIVSGSSNPVNTNSITCSYGGVSLGTATATVNHNSNTTFGRLSVFRAPGAGSGTAKTISVTVTGTSQLYLTVSAVSYANVGGIGVVSTNTGSGSTPTVAATQVPGGTVLWAASSSNTLATQSIGTPVGGTQRAIEVPGTATYCAQLVADSASSGTFSCTTASSPWAAVGIVLLGKSTPAPSSISSPVYSPHVPWLALSSAQQTTTGTRTSQTTRFPDVGSGFQFMVPSWATKINLVGAGGGGAGQGELGVNQGDGADAGSWNAVQLTVGTSGTQIRPGAIITVDVGAGGVGPTVYFANGANGSNTQFHWTDAATTAHTLVCAGGAGGSGVSIFYNGSGLAPHTFDGVTYPGSPDVTPGFTGSIPGGGGGGAPIFLFGGGGGSGIAYIVAKP